MTRIKRRPGTIRQTDAELIEHYEIERELADKLKNASREERKKLYRTLYDELYSRLPHHPQLKRKADPARQATRTAKQFARIKGFLNSNSVFMELGPGDCHLSFYAAGRVKRVVAVDVSDEITKSKDVPENFELIITDGTAIDVEPESVDLVYSNQLMEHLHPDDAREQLKAVFKALKPGGIYICTTPHSFMGPFDISRYFDDTATGLHLKEYTNSELSSIMKGAGFKGVSSLRHIGGAYFKFPLSLALFIESLLSLFPFSIRRAISRAVIIKDLLSLTIVATK